MDTFALFSVFSTAKVDDIVDSIPSDEDRSGGDNGWFCTIA